MPFGQGIPTASDKCEYEPTMLIHLIGSVDGGGHTDTCPVCPEHEHWQQRTLLNPISTSNHFTAPSLEPPIPNDDNLFVDRPVFSTKNQNVEESRQSGRVAHKA